MKNTLVTILLVSLTLGNGLFAQEFERNPGSFDKITVSPKINLILQKGAEESVKIAYHNIDPRKINIELYGKRLRIFLEEARYVDKRVRRYDDGYSSKISVYHDVSITAYVTYRELTEVEMRGSEDLMCASPIVADEFKLTVYGEANVQLDSIKVEKFKVSLYGENRLKVLAGTAEHQVYRLFGENRIDTRGLISHTAAARIYGEGRLRINAEDEVRLNSFDEPKVDITGNAHIYRGIMIGNTSIYTH